MSTQSITAGPISRTTILHPMRWTRFSRRSERAAEENKELFPVEQIIRDSAIFKASPFHKLTEEQIRSKDFITLRIMQALTKGETGQLILVTGEAGSGKTVLMSSLFYELNQLSKDDPENLIFKDTKNFW